MSVSEQLDEAIGEMVYNNIREAIGPLERKAEDARLKAESLARDLARRLDAITADRAQERAKLDATVAQVQWATTKLGELEAREPHDECRSCNAVRVLEREMAERHKLLGQVIASVQKLEAEVAELRKVATFAHAHVGAPVGRITLR